MSWSDVLGHDRVIEQFRTAVRRDRLASTFLFVGAHGIGKRTFAIRLAQALLCGKEGANATLEPCGDCPSCLQVLAGSHPDVVQVRKPDDKAVIPVELLIGDREHRMREGLCHDISLMPYSGKRKVAILDDADLLGIEGANCLLKTLEEPPGKSILILIGTSVQRQLPTILSRCQIVHFQRLSEEQIAQLLRQHHLAEEDQIETLAALANGSLAEALENMDDELRTFRRQFVDDLCRNHWNSAEISKAVTKFVESIGTEGVKRRRRLNQLLDYTAEFYRGIMLTLAQADVQVGAELQQAVKNASGAWLSDRETAALCSARTLEALGHVAASGNLATIIEAWLDDLYRISHPAAAK